MKKLQIVRVDNDSVQKADLQLGNNIIGRGVATGCDDRRVSRHAVTINVSPEGEMTISPVYLVSSVKALVFRDKVDDCSDFRKKLYWTNSHDVQCIHTRTGSTVPIHTGDVFSLLSDQFWFKLVAAEDTMEEDDISLKRKADETTEEEPIEKKIRAEGSVEALLSPHGNLNDVPSSIGVDHGTEELTILDYDDTTSATIEEPATEDIYGASAPEEGSTVCQSPSPEASIEPVVPQTITPTPSPTNGNVVASKDSKEKLPSLEENASPGIEEAGKKIKWDCGRHFSDQSDQAIVDETISPDSAQPAQSAPNDVAASPATVTSHRSQRNRCTYGSKCYRQSAEHREQFSHPGDSDYNALDNRPECRYGVRCYRKNPQHRKDFKHTIEKRGRPQTPIRARTPETTAGTDQSSLEESVDESEYEPSCCTDSSDDGKSDWDDK